MVVDGLSYDAGTDSGQDYTSANNETNPRETIELLSKRNYPNTPIAKVTLPN